MPRQLVSTSSGHDSRDASNVECIKHDVRQRSLQLMTLQDQSTASGSKGQHFSVSRSIQKHDVVQLHDERSTQLMLTCYPTAVPSITRHNPEKSPNFGCKGLVVVPVIRNDNCFLHQVDTRTSDISLIFT